VIFSGLDFDFDKRWCDPAKTLFADGTHALRQAGFFAVDESPAAHHVSPMRRGVRRRAHLPALTITELYRCRWQVELFFKWIKQHLRIKQFYGTTENAVKTQIWTAVSTYVLVAIVKKRLKIHASLYEM
jgi:hypothetical protein